MRIERLPAPFADVARPDDRPFPAAQHLSLRLKTFRWLMRTQFDAARSPRVVDLGAGHGQFSRIAARLGFSVTAVDARMAWDMTGAQTARRPAEYTPVRSDLRDFEGLDRFDIVLAIGVIYHLPLVDQLALLRRCAGRPLLIDTEIYDAALLPADRAPRFTQVVAEGHAGALCAETGNAWSSAGDSHGFWFTEAALLAAFAAAGRSAVTVLDPPYHSAFGPRRWLLLHA